MAYADARRSLQRLLLSLPLLLQLCGAHLPLEVSQGRYNNLVVAIHRSVPENLTLLEEIKAVIQNASYTLLLATYRSGQSHSLAFGNVTILVPDTWPERPEYARATWQLYSKSQIRVGPPNPRYGPVPHTEGPGGCGVPGEFTYYPTEFFLDKANAEKMFGVREHLMVHEWGHLRWGLLDELPQENEPQFYIYNKKFYPTRCTEQLDGQMANRNTGLPCVIDLQTLTPEPDCIFVPSMNNRASASLMGHYYVESIKAFCDQADHQDLAYRHNRLAPTQQNRVCRSRSVWQIIGQHADFHTASPPEVDYIPNIQVVRARSRVVVAVLDTSESMDDYNGVPLKKLKAAMVNFIRTVLEPDTKLGVVTFNSGTKLIAPLQTLGPFDGTHRRDLESKVTNLDATSKTDIGDGMMLGFTELLKDAPVGGSIFLVSDGEEDRSSRSKFSYTDAANTLKAGGVTVDILGLGPQADKRLRNLARDTGGNFYTSFSDRNSFDVLSAMMSSAAGMSAGADTPVLLHSVDVPVPPTVFDASGAFARVAAVAIDSSSRGRLQFVFLFPFNVNVKLADFNLTSPAGAVYHSGSKGGRRDESLYMMSLDVEEAAFEAGIWTVDLVAPAMSTDKTNQTVSMVISSKPAAQTGQQPISVSAAISTFQLANNSASLGADLNGVAISATLRSGASAAVLRARVTASVRTPDNGMLSVQLQDNGVGLDLRANDGIYTGVLSPRRLTGVGDYLVSINAESVDGVTGVVASAPLSRAAASPFVDMWLGVIDTRVNYTLTPVTNLARSSLAGSFRLQNFSEAESRIDRVPPSPIASLDLLAVNSTERSVTFTWLAVGDDYDQGRAARYDAYWSTNASELVGPDLVGPGVRPVLPGNLISGNLSQPANSGSRESLSLRFLDAESAVTTVLYVTIRAVDGAENLGGLAFPAAVTFQVLPFADTSRPTVPVGGNPYLGVIIGVVISVVVVAIVIAAVYFGVRKQSHGDSGAARTFKAT